MINARNALQTKLQSLFGEPSPYLKLACKDIPNFGVVLKDHTNNYRWSIVDVIDRLGLTELPQLIAVRTKGAKNCLLSAI